MRTRLTLMMIIFVLVAGVSGVAAFDVTILAPQIELLGDLKEFADAYYPALQDEVNTELVGVAQMFENQLTDASADDNIARFSQQKDLVRGFANAGATASHLGTQRTFIDYEKFAFVVGGGGAVVAPELSGFEDFGDDIERDGDIYLGAAVQPLNASLGINLSRFVEGLRVNAKVGYFSAAAGDLAEEIALESFSVGVGMSYHVLKSRNLPLGLIRWRGLSVSSGLIFQRNTTDIRVELDEIASDEGLTFGDILGTNYNDFETYLTSQNTPLPSDGADTSFGVLTITPELNTSIESRTYTIPLEVNTGIRFLYILELNAGVGVDLVMGTSELTIGATADVDFDASADAINYVVLDRVGSGTVSTSTTNEPQFARPRVSAGVGLNLGPVKLDVPLMYYFDADGPGAMVGVNVGVVW